MVIKRKVCKPCWEQQPRIFPDAEIQELSKEMTRSRSEYAFTKIYNSLVFLRVSFRWWVAIHEEMSARHARHSIQLCSLTSMSRIYECISERNKAYMTWNTFLFFFCFFALSHFFLPFGTHTLCVYSVMIGLWDSAIRYALCRAIDVCIRQGQRLWSTDLWLRCVICSYVHVCSLQRESSGSTWLCDETSRVCDEVLCILGS